MAKGNVGSAVATIEAKKRGLAESGNRQRKLYFKLKDGESAVVRFLEEGEELHWAWVHQTPAQGNLSWGLKVPCRDQGEEGEPIDERCPGCERNYKRQFQGVVNVIWRDAPVLERDDDNRLVRDTAGNLVVSGKADSIALWISGVTVFEDLEDLDNTYGLTSRDFLVKRRGADLSTRYTISPADPDGGPQKMSKADIALAGEKYDLTEYVVPPTYDSWGKAFTSNSTNKTTENKSLTQSPFKRNR